MLPLAMVLERSNRGTLRGKRTRNDPWLKHRCDLLLSINPRNAELSRLFTSKVITKWYGSGTPPFFWSFGIKDLGGGSRQVFGFKGLAGKVFKNQRLNLSRSGENGVWGSFEGHLDSGTDLETAPVRPHSYRGARWVLSQWISSADGGDQKRSRVRTLSPHRKARNRSSLRDLCSSSSSPLTQR